MQHTNSTYYNKYVSALAEADDEICALVTLSTKVTSNLIGALVYSRSGKDLSVNDSNSETRFTQYAHHGDALTVETFS